MQISKLSTYSLLAHLKGGIVNFETIINGGDFLAFTMKKNDKMWSRIKNYHKNMYANFWINYLSNLSYHVSDKNLNK